MRKSKVLKKVIALSIVTSLALHCIPVYASNMDYNPIISNDNVIYDNVQSDLEGITIATSESKNRDILSTSNIDINEEKSAEGIEGGYAVCADVDAQYDDESDKWSADIDILVSNTSGGDLRDIPLQVIPKISTLKEDTDDNDQAIHQDQIPIDYFDFIEEPCASSYQGFGYYGSGTAEVAFEGNACSITRLDNGTDAIIHCHVDTPESYGYLKYSILVGGEEFGNDKDGQIVLSAFDEAGHPGDFTDWILGSVWIDSSADYRRQDSEEKVAGILVKLWSQNDGSCLEFAVTDKDGSFALPCDAASRPLHSEKHDFSVIGEQSILDAYLEVVNIDGNAYTFPVKKHEYVENNDNFMNPAENHLLSISGVTQGNRSCIVDCVPCSQKAAVPGLAYTYIDVPLRKNPDGLVRRLYNTVLSREADESEVRIWTDRLISDGISAEKLVRSFFDSREFQAKDLSDDAFLDIVYQAVLGRNPDEAGKNSWQMWLDKGLTRDMVIINYIKSVEFGNYCIDKGINHIEEDDRAYREKSAGVTAFVNRLYQVLLERAGEPQGLDYWCRLLIEKEQTGSQVANGFVGSEEFKQRGLSDRDYVASLYKSLQGREPDGKGMGDWVALLEDGMSRNAIFKGFAKSAEFSELCNNYRINAR